MINKIWISYYYQIRFLRPNQIPIATTLSTPPWFRKEGKAYLDKRNVLNGFRSTWFVPNKNLTNLCRGPEHKEICGGDPNKCSFLQGYKEQLRKIKWEDLQNHFEQIIKKAETDFYNTIERPEIVLIVYEAFMKNKCSEAWPLKEWFDEIGHPVDFFVYDMAAEKLQKEKDSYDF